jgi:hypothetical protein
MFRKDHLAFGAMIGAVVPVVIYLLLELITFKNGGVDQPVFDEKTRLVLAIVANMLPFRQYMLKMKLEQTGKGILLVTFIYAFAYLFVLLR